MAKYKISFVRSPKNKEWFWRIVHRNKREICRSSETYKRRIDCSRALTRLFEAQQDGEVAMEALDA